MVFHENHSNTKNSPKFCFHLLSGGFFLHDNTSEFLKSTVQTTLDSMVPLSQVLFPSVVVCNINQIRKSLFNELGFYDNETLVRIMYEDFIKVERRESSLNLSKKYFFEFLINLLN